MSSGKFKYFSPIARWGVIAMYFQTVLLIPPDIDYTFLLYL